MSLFLDHNHNNWDVYDSLTTKRKCKKIKYRLKQQERLKLTLRVAFNLENMDRIDNLSPH